MQDCTGFNILKILHNCADIDGRRSADPKGHINATYCISK